MCVIEFIDAKPPEDKVAAAPTEAAETATAAEPVAGSSTTVEEPSKAE